MKTKVAPETLSNVPYIFISLVIQLLFQNKVSVMQRWVLWDFCSRIMTPWCNVLHDSTYLFERGSNKNKGFKMCSAFYVQNMSTNTIYDPWLLHCKLVSMKKKIMAVQLESSCSDPKETEQNGELCYCKTTECNYIPFCACSLRMKDFLII